MNIDELEVLYSKISKDVKYKPIIDCIVNHHTSKIREQFIAKEQLLDRCEDDKIIYSLSENPLTEIQVLGMNNKELRHKNDLLLKQNIKLREFINEKKDTITLKLADLEIDYLKKENSELKYNIRN